VLAGQENFPEAYLQKLRAKVRPATAICIQIAATEPLIGLDYFIVTGARRVHSVYQPTNRCPELAPPGRHLFLAAARPEISPEPVDWKKELELCMKDLKDLIPDFEKRAHILLTGCYHGEWPGMHARLGTDISRRTPIRNLYNVGDGVKPPGTTALPGAVESACKVFEDII